jgi:hypothetical protein
MMTFVAIALGNMVLGIFGYMLGAYITRNNVETMWLSHFQREHSRKMTQLMTMADNIIRTVPGMVEEIFRNHEKGQAQEEKQGEESGAGANQPEEEKPLELLFQEPEEIGNDN